MAAVYVVLGRGIGKRWSLLRSFPTGIAKMIFTFCDKLKIPIQFKLSSHKCRDEVLLCVIDIYEGKKGCLQIRRQKFFFPIIILDSRLLCVIHELERNNIRKVKLRVISSVYTTSTALSLSTLYSI